MVQKGSEPVNYKLLQQRKDKIMEERINILVQVTELHKSECMSCVKRNGGISTCRDCPVYSQFQEHGERLMISLAELRGLRGRMKLSKDLGGVTMSKVLTVEGYNDLKAQGLSDKEVREMYGMDNNQLYKFKKENGLVTPRPRRAKEENNTEAPKNDKAEAVAELKESPMTQDSIRQEFEEIKAMIKQLQDEKATLQEENQQLHNELWTDRINRIFRKQMEFDAMVIENHGLDMEQLKDEQLLALIVEIAETANEEQSFKYWKIQKEVNREKLLEEMADILHMTASVGLHRGFKNITVEVEKWDTVTNQILNMISNVLAIADYKTPGSKEEEFNRVINLIVGLMQMLGFTWQEIEEAYLKKHAENVNRQNNGY